MLPKTPDIYEDTILHAGIVCDVAINKKFPQASEEEQKRIANWLESRLVREYEKSDVLRSKLIACLNSSTNSEESARMARDWLTNTLLPTWLPESLEDIKAPCTIWKFENAPEDLKKYASQGGDEDWLVELPPLSNELGLDRWMLAIDSTRDPIELDHPTKKGWQILVGCH